MKLIADWSFSETQEFLCVNLPQDQEKHRWYHFGNMVLVPFRYRICNTPLDQLRQTESKRTGRGVRCHQGPVSMGGVCAPVSALDCGGSGAHGQPLGRGVRRSGG